MNKEKLFEFIKKQKIAYVSSVDENGYPVTRAMFVSHKIKGDDIYFSTNTSSKKIKHYLNNNKACVYFYKPGLFKFKGLTIKGTMQVCTDQETKNMLWCFGDTKYYEKGVTDPDYCVLKFTPQEAEYYCNLKIENIKFN